MEERQTLSIRPVHRNSGEELEKASMIIQAQEDADYLITMLGLEAPYTGMRK